MEKIQINYIGHFGTTASDIVRHLKNKECDIVIEINSYGGEFFEGFAIYNVLKNYVGNVNIIIDGLAAGISLIVAMAGSEICMTSKSYIILKNPSVYNSKGSTWTNDILDIMKSKLIDIYMTRKLTISRETISKMMNKEMCIDYKNALKYGFIDRIIIK